MAGIDWEGSFRVNRSAHTSDLTWENILRQRVCPDTLVIGMGNRLRSDDGVGPAIAARLQERSCLQTIDCGSTPENFLFKIITRRPESVLIVDAVHFNGQPGEARVMEADEFDHADASTHAISPRLFAAVLQQETRADCFFLAVQPLSTALGEGLSPAVNQTVDRIVEVLAEIADAHRARKEPVGP